MGLFEREYERMMREATGSANPTPTELVMAVLLQQSERIVALEAALSACRKPIICSVFGMPDEEVRRLVTLIDAALAGASK